MPSGSELFRAFRLDTVTDGLSDATGLPRVTSTVMALTVLGMAVRAFMPTRKHDEQRDEPGSAGERVLQERLGTSKRAEQFYKNQVTDRLTPMMAEFIQRMEMAFIATSDQSGECDCSFRAGPGGFIKVIDDRTIAYPDYRGNGVMASMGNMLENPHIGILMIDFTQDLIGMHVNGDASIVPPAQMREFDLDVPEVDQPAGRRPVQWVLVHVTEAYVHCSKHIPLMIPQSRVRHWGTDNPRHKGGDYFGVAARRAAAATGHAGGALNGSRPPASAANGHAGGGLDGSRASTLWPSRSGRKTP